MKFPDPLIRGKLIKRYKRFLTDVELEDGSKVVAHCANSGSMLSVNEPGAEVWLSPARNPERKLRYTWESIRIGRTLVGINTSHPNALAADAVAKGRIPELAGYASLRREVKYGKNSRIDLLLERNGPDDGEKCYVEIKSVTMKRDLGRDAPVEFPDAVTTRGAKHLVELTDMVKQGHRAVMLYLTQRADSPAFAIAGDIDPDYEKGLAKAMNAGVEVLCYASRVTRHGITLGPSVPLAFSKKMA
ncbi:MAG: DNA/RNA nuclease SfsA [Rhodospirillales bacterium]|nr:DNA/RNA nuclease SfsA [Alphaproteobacteria bacterium]MBL6947049.1 DNA/RNA nuclease SfsA [Rhodospirillales bacterium]